MTVTVTDPDFVFELDWKYVRYKRSLYIACLVVILRTGSATIGSTSSQLVFFTLGKKKMMTVTKISLQKASYIEGMVL